MEARKGLLKKLFCMTLDAGDVPTPVFMPSASSFAGGVNWSASARPVPWLLGRGDVRHCAGSGLWRRGWPDPGRNFGRCDGAALAQHCAAAVQPGASWLRGHCSEVPVTTTVLETGPASLHSKQVMRVHELLFV